jgi:hypothetical protein
MQVRYKLFKSSLTTWNDMCTEAAAFASTVQLDRLVSISHSADNSQGVIVVWYWGSESEGSSE